MGSCRMISFGGILDFVLGRKVSAVLTGILVVADMDCCCY